jgi:hypothetical protein
VITRVFRGAEDWLRGGGALCVGAAVGEGDELCELVGAVRTL